MEVEVKYWEDVENSLQQKSQLYSPKPVLFCAGDNGYSLE